jgi:hypothetical protein
VTLAALLLCQHPNAASTQTMVAGSFDRLPVIVARSPVPRSVLPRAGEQPFRKVMTMADDDFTDLMDDDESGASKKQTMGFVTSSPAVNSVEIALREAMMMDPILRRPMMFSEDGQEETPLPPDDPDIAAARPGIASDYMAHIARARSMGAGVGANWQRYRELCRLDGVQAINHVDDTTRKGVRQ